MARPCVCLPQKSWEVQRPMPVGSGHFIKCRGGKLLIAAWMVPPGWYAVGDWKDSSEQAWIVLL